MPSFHNNGAEVHYETVGDGPPLLLLAGTASDGASWTPLLPLLNGHMLILIDNRGCGRTRVEGPIEVAEMVDDAAALLDHLGIARADVVGHSLGGMLGLRLAAAHPGKVRRLVSMTTTNVPGAKERALFRDMARHYFTMLPEDWFQWLFSAPFFASEDGLKAAAAASVSYAYRQSPGDFARQVAAIDRMPTLDLSRVGCPVLAVAAELDLLVPPRAVVDGHAGLPDVWHATIAGAAHSVHWERPAEVAAAIRDFVSDPETTA